MKPALLGLLVLVATASLVLFALLAFPMKPMSAFVEPSGASGRTKSTQRETKTTQQRKSTNSGGVFSGSDPSDPRVYH